VIHGLLNLDKSQGWTSHDAVAKVRRLVGQKQVGHVGTLDPNATGVLLLCLGKGTKLSSYFMRLEKEYHAFFRFGAVTNTQDADGEIIEERPTEGLTEEAVRDAIGRYQGDLMQTPPMVSAVKVGGQRLYHLARRGEEVERPARPIHIRTFDLIHFESPVAEVRLSCSKGTYVRTLAADIGEDLGCGAYLDRLTRVRIGSFCVEDAVSIEAFGEAAAADRSTDHVLPLEKAIEGFRSAVLRTMPGRWSSPSVPRTLEALEALDPPVEKGEFLRIVDRGGRAVGVVEAEGERGKLRRVLLFGS